MRVEEAVVWTTVLLSVVGLGVVGTSIAGTLGLTGVLAGGKVPDGDWLTAALSAPLRGAGGMP